MGTDRTSEVAVIGAGLAGLTAARALAGAGVDVVVLEAQDRVGGRTLTVDLGDGAFVDHGGQWVSPGQERLPVLASELGVELFPSWDEGLTVHWKQGARATAPGLFPAGEERSMVALRKTAAILSAMAETLPEEAPWEAPEAQAWDRQTLHGWLAENVDDPLARHGFARSLEGVFAGGPGETSLLAALAIIRSGAHEVTRLVSDEQLGPERRFVGGAQQVCQRMSAELGDRVVLEAFTSAIEWADDAATVHAGRARVRARRVVVTLAPTLAGRIRYLPTLPAARDHLTQRLPMGWVIKVHCVYESRFWAPDGLSGKVVSDEGAVRATADSSPPSGSPGILVGFIEGDEARRLAPASPAERKAEVLACPTRYFGEQAGEPLAYHEHRWGDDPYARGAYGGYWTPGVWTTYGPALRAPLGPLHWAGTETSTAWNGKLEGAVHSGQEAARRVLESTSALAS